MGDGRFEADHKTKKKRDKQLEALCRVLVHVIPPTLGETEQSYIKRIVDEAKVLRNDINKKLIKNLDMLLEIFLSQYDGNTLEEKKKDAMIAAVFQERSIIFYRLEPTDPALDSKKYGNPEEDDDYFIEPKAISDFAEMQQDKEASNSNKGGSYKMLAGSIKRKPQTEQPTAASVEIGFEAAAKKTNAAVAKRDEGARQRRSTTSSASILLSNLSTRITQSNPFGRVSWFSEATDEENWDDLSPTAYLDLKDTHQPAPRSPTWWDRLQHPSTWLSSDSSLTPLTSLSATVPTKSFKSKPIKNFRERLEFLKNPPKPDFFDRQLKSKDVLDRMEEEGKLCKQLVDNLKTKLKLADDHKVIIGSPKRVKGSRKQVTTVSSRAPKDPTSGKKKETVIAKVYSEGVEVPLSSDNSIRTKQINGGAKIVSTLMKDKTKEPIYIHARGNVSLEEIMTTIKRLRKDGIPTRITAKTMNVVASTEGMKVPEAWAQLKAELLQIGDVSKKCLYFDEQRNLMIDLEFTHHDLDFEQGDPDDVWTAPDFDPNKDSYFVSESEDSDDESTESHSGPSNKK